jgi:Holliday junction resolvase RusA-like endonuclease
VLKFTMYVYGKPATQGSTIAQAIYRKDRTPVMKNGRVVTIARPDSPDLKSWRHAVASAAAQAYSGPLLTTQAVCMSIVFYRPRPTGHFGTGKNAGVLKPNAPEFPTTRPDTLKLARAIEDALTGVIWKDDSQVVYHRLAKRWGDRYVTVVQVLVQYGVNGSGEAK